MDADPRDPAIRQAITAWYEMAVDYLADGFGWDFVDRTHYDSPEPFHPSVIGSQNLDWITEGALDFLEQSHGVDEPFFLYVPATTPHHRYQDENFDQGHPLATPAGILDEAPDLIMAREAIRQAVVDAGLPPHDIEGLWLDEGFNAPARRLPIFPY